MYCIFCNASLETRDHLFLLCLFAQEVWKLCTGFFNSPTPHNSIDKLFLHWSSKAIKKEVRPAWNILTVAVCWLLWKERNNRIFKSTGADYASSVADSLYFVKFLSGAAAKKQLLSVVGLLNFHIILQANGALLNQLRLWKKFSMMVAVQNFQSLIFF